MNDIRRIMVVATDIKHSRDAVQVGVSLARKYEAELVVLHVEHDPFGVDGIPGDQVILNAALASRAENKDPIDLAVLGGLKDDQALKGFQVLHFQPFDPVHKRTEATLKGTNGMEFKVTKGAPQVILELSANAGQVKPAIERAVNEFAARGFRSLGVARSDAQGSWQFLGVLPLFDPPRDEARATIATARQMGVNVKMVTGDQVAIARETAAKLGLGTNMLDASGFGGTAHHETARLAEAIEQADGFAQVFPEHKFHIVDVLQQRGHIVGMTGDGVNDAPALKAAHIGVAMGGRGTDVARESASLVLLDDDFSSIVEAVKLGRRIFDNIRKAVSYILAIHVPIAGLSLVPVFFAQWPLILLPVHIVFLELIIDPSCTMIFEAEEAEPDIMRRRPRDSSQRLFGLRSIAASVVQGFAVLAVVLGVYIVARRTGHDAGIARALTFSSLVVANIALILANRSLRRTGLAMLTVPNRVVWFVTGGATLFLSLALTLPAARALFRFEAPHALDLVLCLVAGALTVSWFELGKLLRRTPG